MIDLITELPNLKLVRPSIKRDAPASVIWLEGDEGRNTLRLMGNTDTNTQPTNLAAEQQRISEFLDSKDQLTWTILYEDKPVGAIWVHLKSFENLPAPSIHIMLGDPKIRGKNLGTYSMQTVIKHLRSQKYDQLFSRYLLANEGSAALLQKLGFEVLESAYKDKDGLEFQNVVLGLR
ncbi:MAG TPA: GNAT family N-acetyltransferase [Candidatus Saccharimonadales bacterium]|nr:GNAT family N-acetyltransferase [Candidatus Saccharimonadales bacterium]